MATKHKDSSHGKEKILGSSTHHHIDNSHGKSPRTPKSSSTTNSPDKVNHVPPEKQIPNYLKHTISSSKETSSRLGKKPTISDDNNPRLLRRKSFDKPPSNSQLQRTLSSNSRDKSTTPITKPSSPSPRTTISPNSERSTIRTPKPVAERVIVSPKTTSERLTISHKTISDRTPKAPRIVKTVQPISAKPKPLRRTLSNTSSKNGVKSSPAPSVASSTAPTSPNGIENTSTFDVEQEDKAILEQEILEKEILKVKEEVDEEKISFEVPPGHDQVLVDNHTSFPESSEKDSFIEKIRSFDSTPTILVEQVHEEVMVSTPQIEETTEEKTIEPVQNENQHEVEKEQVIMNIHIENNDIEEPLEVLAELEQEGENEVSREIEGEEKTVMEQTKESEVECEEEGTQNLKLKEKEVEEEEDDNEETKAKDKAKAEAEAENLSFRRQQVNKGKKESQAYNDVIEETASKLVQKRKNKVLALVGAFETVISLQEPEGQ